MQSEQLIQEFGKECGVKARLRINGKELTTFAIGGEIPALIEPDSVSSAQSAVTWLYKNGVEYRLIGAGSNLLIPDQGVSVLAIRLGRGFRRYSSTKRPGGKFLIEVGGAMPLMKLSRELSDKGICGLEFAGGIPASMGGALYMNAGAHGGEIGDLVDEVSLLNSAGEIEVLSASQLNFTYRRSNLPLNSLILSVKLQMVEGDVHNSKAMRDSFLRDRKLRQPLTLPSAGSVFKNPSPEQSAGSILEGCGMKGQRVGGAEVSVLHANWIVNPSREATATDVCELIGICQKRAKEQFGLELEPELVRW